MTKPPSQTDLLHARIKELFRENARLRETLAIYAEPANWYKQSDGYQEHGEDVVFADPGETYGGQLAADALVSQEDENG